MIAISKVTQDSGGALVLDELRRSKMYDGRARVSRSATLDGGVVIDHQGYVAGDRTIILKVELSETDAAALKTLFENETLIYAATADGFFSAVIESLSGDGGVLDVTILLKEAV
jgi:hypothetical protein